MIWLNNKKLCFFDKEQTVKKNQGWVYDCVDSLEKKIKYMKEHMQDINPMILIIYSINLPVRDITCPLTVASAKLVDSNTIFPNLYFVTENVLLFLVG
jgi:hypothetical protein